MHIPTLLSETLHVSSKGVMLLCQVDEGCIQLTFQLPSFVQQNIFPLFKEQEKSLAAMGVMKLTCGKYQFLVRLSESTCQCIVSMHVYCRFGMRHMSTAFLGTLLHAMNAGSYSFLDVCSLVPDNIPENV